MNASSIQIPKAAMKREVLHSGRREIVAHGAHVPGFEKNLQYIAGALSMLDSYTRVCSATPHAHFGVANLSWLAASLTHRSCKATVCLETRDLSLVALIFDSQSGNCTVPIPSGYCWLRSRNL